MGKTKAEYQSNIVNALAFLDAICPTMSAASGGWDEQGQMVDNWGFSWDWLLRVGVVLFAAYVAYQLLLGRRADFVIRLRKGCVEYKGHFPLSHQPAVTQLLLNDLALEESVKIMGSRNGRRMRLWFRGKISDAEKQRIRNFLTNRL